MRARGFTFAILIFEAFFLNVVVPGHQRGVVQLPGSNSAAAQECPFCCCGQSSSPSHSGDSKKETPAGPARTCAICAFAAQLSIPPAFDYALAPLMPAGPVLNRSADSPIVALAPLPFDERGPPHRA